MYDLNDTLELVLPGPEGNRVCALRHPSDQEWYDRYNSRYTVIRNLGRGETEQKQMNREAADMELLSKIQLNKEVKFDEAEAITLMDQLALCEVVDVTRNGRSMSITLSTILGDVLHHVNIPSHSDLKYATEASVKVRGGKNNSSIVRIDMKPEVELYEKIKDSIEGYSTSEPTKTPAIHKYKVIDVISGEISQITAKQKAKLGENPPSAPVPTNLV